MIAVLGAASPACAFRSSSASFSGSPESERLLDVFRSRCRHLVGLDARGDPAGDAPVRSLQEGALRGKIIQDDTNHFARPAKTPVLNGAPITTEIPIRRHFGSSFSIAVCSSNV